MSRSIARNLSLLLMLASFPLISIGTTGNRPVVWWLGLGALALGALIPPVLRFVPAEQDTEKKETHRHATDLGDSRRVC